MSNVTMTTLKHIISDVADAREQKLKRIGP